MHPSPTATLGTVLWPLLLAWQHGMRASIVLLALTGIGYAGEASHTSPAPSAPPGAAAPYHPASGRGAPLAKHPRLVNEILLEFASETAPETRAAAHARVGATEVQGFTLMQKRWWRVRLKSGLQVPDALALYRQHAAVVHAEPNHRISHRGRAAHELGRPDWQRVADQSVEPTALVDAHGSTPNDPFLPRLANLFQIDAPGAWHLTTGSTRVVVAVLSTGVDYHHVDLAPQMWRNTPDCNHNTIDDDGNGYIDDCYGIDPVNNDTDPLEDGFYGTHEAGTIGAVGNNGRGVVGVNWQVSLLACKVLNASGDGTVADALACLQYVQTMKERGLNIVAINMHWVPPDSSQALYDAIEAQRQQGTLVIVPAGDDSADLDQVSNIPNYYDLPNVIVVAATNPFEHVAVYSNYGRHTVDVGAPGGADIFPGILSTLPGNAYGGLFGSTAAAVPHVTGVVALLKAQDLDRDWRALKNLVLAGGDPLLTGTTLSERQLNAHGSVHCTDARVLSRVRPRSDSISVALGVPVDVSVLHIRCATPAGPVTVMVQPGNQLLTLQDDGEGPDLASGDGRYAARWHPATAGTYTLTFPGDDAVTVHVLSPYTVTATPFVWREISGTNLDLSSFGFDFPQIAPPFPITFGGVDFPTLVVSPHGTVNFTGPFTTASFSDSENQALPTAASPTLVAPFWDRVAPEPGTDHNVFWAVIGPQPHRELVIEWRQVAHEFWLCTWAAGVTFQIVFFEGRSDILFNYAQTAFGGGCRWADHGAGATIGVQITVDHATQFSLNTPSLHTPMALLWRISAR